MLFTVGLILTCVIVFLLGTAAVRTDPPRAGVPSLLGKIDFERVRSFFVVVSAFTVALYLIFVSILATQIFEQKLADVDEPRTRLVQSLSTSPAQELQEIYRSLAPELITTSIEGLDKANPLADRYIKSIGSQIKALRATLEERIKTPELFAKRETDYLLNQFNIQNRGRAGTHQAEDHVIKLSQFFDTWISNWKSTAASCRNTINFAQSKLADYIAKVQEALQKDPSGSNFFPPRDPSLDPFEGEKMCDFNSALSNSSVPPRVRFDPQLPDFIHMAAGWLLQTEAPNLALIIGVVGFALFGSLSASFIRAGVGETSHNYVITFISGIAAALLVFLAVVGGLAIFTRDSTPNPYGVFFTCLVAAVFSEDVWNWARKFQLKSLGPKLPTNPN